MGVTPLEIDRVLAEAREALRDGQHNVTHALVECLICRGDLSSRQLTEARLLLGVSAGLRGDPYQAEELLLLALAGDIAGPDRCLAMYNLAVTYERCKRPEAAIGLYVQVAGESRRHGLERTAARCYLNAAWLCTYYGMLDAADRHLAEPEGFRWMPHDHTALRSYLALKQGDANGALELAEQVYRQNAPTAWAAVMAAYVGGMVALDRDLATAHRLHEWGKRHVSACEDSRLCNLWNEFRCRL